MIDTLKPWTPKTEVVIDHGTGMRIERPDYWSRPYPASPKMMAAVQAGLERPLPTRERDTR